jgi:RNA polymerase sigma factor (TIGR02999 family)
MSEITRVLSEIDAGDPNAVEKLLPLVYDELRRLAAQKMMHEAPGQTLQATALVHEAYVRLVDVETPQHWNGRGHFFAAAAEAMRRILVENVRRKRGIKHGGGHQRVTLDEAVAYSEEPADELLALNDALDKLAGEDQKKAELVWSAAYLQGRSLREGVGSRHARSEPASHCRNVQKPYYG